MIAPKRLFRAAFLAGVALAGTAGQVGAETRALTSAGSTPSRYSGVCSSKSSQHGIETTRPRTPCSSSCLAAS